MKKSDSKAQHPVFLGIGAARSGTTWIDAQLRKSPQIWMPRRKELHYFTRSLEYPSSSHLADNSLIKRLISLSGHNIRFKRELIKAFGRDILYFDVAQLVWDSRYFFGNYSDEWYQSLFESKSDYVTGEITPAYSLLNDNDLARLSRFLPKLKLIFIMRNPIDRAWSTIGYHEKRENKLLTKLPPNEIIEYLSREAITVRSNYVNIIKRWEKYYPKEQILTAFYDEISCSPSLLLDRICDFLGIDHIHLTDKDKKRRVNVSVKSEMPTAVREYLTEYYRDQIQSLSEIYGSYAKDWLERLDKT